MVTVRRRQLRPPTHSPDGVEAGVQRHASGGRTLHKLRHSRLTHLAEAGEDATLIKAMSRHRSLRSLERYVDPSNAAVALLTDRHDPNRRGR